MLAKVISAAVLGVDAFEVQIEVDISGGLPCVMVVGLPDAAVQESRERVRSAIRNAGLPFPSSRIVINLAPADVRKEGPAFDLPIALAVLAAQGVIPQERLEGTVISGELALDGAIRDVLGRTPEHIASPGTYDQKHVARLGHIEDCVAYGPGVLDLAHQPDEWVGVQDMVDSAQVMGLALHRLLG